MVPVTLLRVYMIIDHYGSQSGLMVTNYSQDQFIVRNCILKAIYPA